MSAAAGSYLGWETGTDGITRVVKTNSPKEWIVKSIDLNGYTYSPFVQHMPHYLFNFRSYSITTSNQPLALTDHDTSEV